MAAAIHRPSCRRPPLSFLSSSDGCHSSPIPTAFVLSTSSPPRVSVHQKPLFCSPLWPSSLRSLPTCLASSFLSFAPEKYFGKMWCCVRHAAGVDDRRNLVVSWVGCFEVRFSEIVSEVDEMWVILLERNHSCS